MARYDPLRKLERNRQVAEYARAHPDLALREIGEVFSLSPARIHQILKKQETQRGQT